MCMSGSSGLQSLVPASGQRRRSGRRSSSTSCCLSLLAFPLLEQHPEPLRPRAGSHPSFFSWAGRLKAHLGSLEQNELLCQGGNEPWSWFLLPFPSLGGLLCANLPFQASIPVFTDIFVYSWCWWTRKGLMSSLKWLFATLHWKCWARHGVGSFWSPSSWKFDPSRASDVKAIFCSLLLSFG